MWSRFPSFYDYLAQWQFCILVAIGISSGSGLGALKGSVAKLAQGGDAAFDAFGDPLPQFAKKRIGTTRLRHGQPLEGVAFCASPDMLASVGRDSRVCLWDSATGKLLAELEGNIGGDPLLYIRVLYLAESHTICAYGGGGYLTFWDSKTNKVLANLRAHKPGNYGDCLVATMDGKRIVTTGSDGKIRVWNASERTLLREMDLQSKKGHNLAISSEGIVLASVVVPGNTIVFWDFSTGKELRRVDGGPGEVYCVALSPNGTVAVSGTFKGPTRIWDVAAGKELYRIELDKTASRPILNVVFALDGNSFFAASGDGVIRQYNTKTGNEIGKIKASFRGPSPLCINAAGTMLATGGGFVQLWDLLTLKEVCPLPGSLRSSGPIAFSKDGSTLLSCGTTVRLWSVATGKEVGLPGIIEGMDDVPLVTSIFSLNGDYVALARLDGRIQIWDVKAGASIRQLNTGDKQGIRPIAFAPDGKTLASASANGIVHLWDIAKGNEIRRFGNELRPIESSKLAMNEDVLVLWTFEGPFGKSTRRIFAYAVGTGKMLWENSFTGPTTPSNIRLSKDGRVLAEITDKRIDLVNLKSGALLGSLELGARRAGVMITAVSFFDNDNALAVGYSNGLIELWSIKKQQRIVDLVGHRGAIVQLCLSPDGGTLASASGDTTILLWDLAAAYGGKK